MKSLPAGVIPEQYAVNSSNPWLHLMEFLFPAPYGTMYFVRNTEDVTFNGQTYTAFPLEVDVVRESGAEIPTRVIRVSNVLKILETELEALEGAVAQQVIWTVVNYKNLSTYTENDYADFRVTYEIVGTEVDVDWVTFTIGVPFINLQRFPLDYYNANCCQWLRVYGATGQECGYTGALPTCDGTLDGSNGCVVHGNESRYGGFVGLVDNNFRVVP